MVTNWSRRARTSRSMTRPSRSLQLLATDHIFHFANLHVSSAEKSKTWSLIAATRLDTDEPVLNNVNTTNTVTTSSSVGGQEELNRVGNSLLLTVLSVFQLNRDTLVEVNDKVLRLVRSSERVGGQFPHVRRRCGVGVLEDAGLVRAVSQVLIHTPGLGLGRGHRDALLGGIVEQGITAGEAVVEDGVTPRGDDLDVGLEGVEGKFETNLVVTLAGASVGDSDSAFSLEDS